MKKQPINRQAWYEFAVTFLQEIPVVEVTTFEDAIKLHFKDEWTKELDENLTGRQRSRGLNEIDWIKAELTTNRLIQYFKIKTVRHIIFLEPLGVIQGRLIVFRNDVQDVLEQIERLTG